MDDQQYPRPQSIVELLVASIRLYRTNFLPFVLITALVLVPYNLLTFVLGDSTTPLSTLDVISGVLRGISRPNGGGWPSLIYNLIVQPIMFGALILTAAQCYRQQPVSIGNNFQTARSRWITLLGLAFQKGLFLLIAIVPGLVVGLLAPMLLVNVIPADWFFLYISFLPGLYVAIGLSLLLMSYVGVRLIIAAQAVLLEDLYTSDSLVRSRKLTKGNWWHATIFAGLVLLLQFGLPALIIGAAMSGVELLSLDTQLVSVLQMALVTIAQVVALPFSFVAHTLLFFDLRIRSQGFDPEQSDPLAPGWKDSSYPSWLNA